MLTACSGYERFQRIHEFSSAAPDLTDTILNLDAAAVVGVVKLNDELGVALAEAAAAQRGAPLCSR